VNPHLVPSQDAWDASAGASGRVSVGASGKLDTGAKSGSGPSSPGVALMGASARADTGAMSGSPASRPLAGPTAASGAAGLSTAKVESTPPSNSSMHFQSAVHVYPVWHGS
jgi:hypothetical protein